MKTHLTSCLSSTGSVSVKNRKHRAAEVCLCLLCFLLLTAVIVLCVCFTSERKQLLTHISNLTEEREKTLTKYDQILNYNNNLTEEREKTLTKYDQILNHNNNLTKEREQILTNNTKLISEKQQLLKENKIMTGEREQIKKTNELQHGLLEQGRSVFILPKSLKIIIISPHSNKYWLKHQVRILHMNKANLSKLISKLFY